MLDIWDLDITGVTEKLECLIIFGIWDWNSGVRGSGKTALTRKVFDNLPVRRMFSPRIWVSLSDTLHDEPVSVDLRVKILRKMLEQSGCDVSEMMTTYVDIPKLTQKLYQRLMGKKLSSHFWSIFAWMFKVPCSHQCKFL